MQKIAIIGAGISGLTIANKLATVAEVIVFDKSRGLGGRMATRRKGDYHFDHGAQYFVAKTEAFQKFLEEPLAQGYIEQWDANFVEIDGSNILKQRAWSDDFPHYVGAPTMSRLAHFMAKGLTISKGVEVKSIDKVADGWQLSNNGGEQLGTFDWVVSTCPVEQTRKLLPCSFVHHPQLSNINMQACFSLMLGFDKTLPINFQAALIRNSDLSWIAVNNSKPQRPDAFTLLVQSNNLWAEKHQDADRDWIKEHLVNKTEKVLKLSLAERQHEDLHRWLYANTAKHKDNVGDVFLDQVNQLAAVGDWCGNARVESAFLHADKFAEKLKVHL